MCMDHMVLDTCDCENQKHMHMVIKHIWLTCGCARTPAGPGQAKNRQPMQRLRSILSRNCSAWCMMKKCQGITYEWLINNHMMRTCRRSSLPAPSSQKQLVLCLDTLQLDYLLCDTFIRMVFHWTTCSLGQDRKDGKVAVGRRKYFATWSRLKLERCWHDGNDPWGW